MHHPSNFKIILPQYKTMDKFTQTEQNLLLGKTEKVITPPLLKVVPEGSHIHTNYSPGTFLEKMGVAYCPTLRFANTSILKRVVKACPKLYRTNEELGERFQKRIFAGETVNTTVVWVNEELRYSLITNRNLQKDDWIGTYTGLVRPINRITPVINGYCVLYPTKWYSRNLFVIDARFHANFLRYVNHSDTPNLYAQWALDRGLLHLLFFAADTIPRGAHLTINYGEAYWRYRKKSSKTC